MTAEQSNMPTFDQLWDYEHPDVTEDLFRAQLAQLRTGEPDHVELLTQIARAQGLQRHFAAAHATLDQAATGLTEQPARVQVRYHLERGRLFNSAGDSQQAQPWFTKAWSLAQASGEDYYAIDAAHMLAIVAPADQQRAWNLRALARAEQSTDARAARWIGSLHNNLGWTEYAAGNFADALAHFTQALAARQAQGDQRTTHIARWCIAKTLRALNRVEEALAIQQQLLAEDDVNGAADGYVYEELGECYLALQAPAQARPYFARAHQLLAQDAWLVANEGPRLARLQMLGSAAE